MKLMWYNKFRINGASMKIYVKLTTFFRRVQIKADLDKNVVLVNKKKTEIDAKDFSSDQNNSFFHRFQHQRVTGNPHNRLSHIQFYRGLVVQANTLAVVHLNLPAAADMYQGIGIKSRCRHPEN